MRKYYIFSTAVSYTILAIIGLLVVPYSIRDKEYLNLGIFVVIACCLVVFSTAINRFYFSQAEKYELSDGGISLYIKKMRGYKQMYIETRNVKELRYSHSRYVFVCRDKKKYSLSRYKGFLQYEYTLNPELMDFAAHNGIPCSPTRI